MRYQHVLFSILLLLPLQAVLAKEEIKKYPSGAVHFIYNYDGNRRHGVSKEFHENNNLKTEFFYEKGKLTAEKRYRQDGQIEYEFTYKRNKKHEVVREFHSSGKLFRERHLVGGIQEGMEKEYAPDGKLKAERTYIGGKKNGSAKGYFRNGRVQGDWTFKNGVPIAATIFYSTGEKYLVHEFSDGKIDGVSKEYNKKGKLQAKRYYKNDKLVKRVRK
ncbi:toxin-antitoxin system YwqK family antitoxin [Candidatus Venteria ishoeyi]|uniref:MORN repeat variant n=1 Tax=Candidatus Venteria ishoeyi TaxID=1899563 RepID=A0A1H6FFA0_9GAMM|nr:toxin-antitoxin system YwqK family antitoxin [Candidatus Venteria ishoeyi]MDM8546161.1 toxin-antitoxin system YwqK family antitoxin [Candidatus Venteria ishoeyi]SEH08029.1 MORN repeat variant [Candidatus Venteria ishoeyi]